MDASWGVASTHGAADDASTHHEVMHHPVHDQLMHDPVLQWNAALDHAPGDAMNQCSAAMDDPLLHCIDSLVQGMNHASWDDASSQLAWFIP